MFAIRICTNLGRRIDTQTQKNLDNLLRIPDDLSPKPPSLPDSGGCTANERMKESRDPLQVPIHPHTHKKKRSRHVCRMRSHCAPCDATNHPPRPFRECAHCSGCHCLLGDKFADRFTFFVFVCMFGCASVFGVR